MKGTGETLERTRQWVDGLAISWILMGPAFCSWPAVRTRQVALELFVLFPVPMLL